MPVHTRKRSVWPVAPPGTVLANDDPLEKGRGNREQRLNWGERIGRTYPGLGPLLPVAVEIP
ncbi:hypothetical protein NIIDMKKI_11520 [Mycobacterium kansasii]|uniref:Uncharacterized protein n=1 Tax=Mycobacterium kansasii TaxID=1768 RepID=A0A7G1I4K9_MYCKA|nr:hypothetical protein NIIDMKKI_11520 [Mycobacterium kansasii]